MRIVKGLLSKLILLKKNEEGGTAQGRKLSGEPLKEILKEPHEQKEKYLRKDQETEKKERRQSNGHRNDGMTEIWKYVFIK